MNIASGKNDLLTLTVTVPECLYRSPIRADSRDDLPQPTLPTKAVSEPGFTLIFISFNTGFLSLRCENVPSDILRAYSKDKKGWDTQLHKVVSMFEMDWLRSKVDHIERKLMKQGTPAIPKPVLITST